MAKPFLNVGVLVLFIMFGFTRRVEGTSGVVPSLVIFPTKIVFAKWKNIFNIHVRLSIQTKWNVFLRELMEYEFSLRLTPNSRNAAYKWRSSISIYFFVRNYQSWYVAFILRFGICLECYICRGLDSLQPRTRILIKVIKIAILGLYFIVCMHKLRLNFMFMSQAYCSVRVPNCSRNSHMLSIKKTFCWH